MKYILKASGDWCYSQNGLLWPEQIPFDFEATVRRALPNSEIRWEPYLGWGNLPLVLVAELPDNIFTYTLYDILACFTAPLQERGLQNRFYWTEYWGYDYGGEGDWGSVCEDWRTKNDE